MNDRKPTVDRATAVAANLLILLPLAYAAVLAASSSDLYFLSVQEDETLEWATFWSFLVAAGTCFAGAWQRRRATGSFPWFFLGLGAFCFLVAMEEVSWGQRILGYRPPTYFLEHNFQQELNLHNVVDTRWRKLLLEAVIAGYGVVLPLVALVPALGRRLERAGVVVPPVVLVPAFFATFLTYVAYPLEYSGEWVELMLGLAFLFTATLATIERPAKTRPSAFTLHPALILAAAWLVVVALGGASAAASRAQRDTHPQNLVAASMELEALKRDFLASRADLPCGLGKRVHTYVEEYRANALREGNFSRLEGQGLPEARARFFLDPWNLPYWIHHDCTADHRVLYVYTYGPNRRDDSVSWKMRGDDVGVIVREGPADRL